MHYGCDGLRDNHCLRLYLFFSREAFCARPVTLEKEGGVAYGENVIGPLVKLGFVS